MARKTTSVAAIQVEWVFRPEEREPERDEGIWRLLAELLIRGGGDYAPEA